MDTEIALRIDENVLHAAIDMACRIGYSIQELTNFLLEKVVNGNYSEIEDFPVADWIRELNKGNRKK